MILCMLAISASMHAAKDKTVKTVIRAWQLSPVSALPDTLEHAVDTACLNYPMHDVLNDYSISNSWNGNIVSPVLSRVYFARQEKIDDIFAANYQPYIITPGDIRYYNTTIPYSEVAYKKGFTTYHEENEINFLFTGNLNKRINLGLQLNYMNGAGHYMHQEGKAFNGAVFGSYNGDHYNLHAGITFNNLSNFENGGIQHTEDLGSKLAPEDIPVRLNAMSGYKYISGFLNHYYSVCAEREIHDTILVKNDFGEEEKQDSIRIEYIPLMSFAHTFETTNSIRRYIEKTADQGFYENTYYNALATHDSTNVLTIRNTLSVTFEEAFNRVLRFGATVFARNECQRHLYARGATLEQPESIINNPLSWEYGMTAFPDTLYGQQWTNNTYLGASIYKKTGRWIRYDVTGDVCLLGYKQWEFKVDGRIRADFPVGKDSMMIAARVFVKNETPSYYYRNYYSNHFRWENDFAKTYRFYAGGEVRYPTQWVKPAVNVGFENLTNHIYYDMSGCPKQYAGNIQVLSADVKLDLTTPWVNLENHVIFQHSTSPLLPLPQFTLYHNLYYHGVWFKALEAQMGVDMRMFTKYKAPVLNPATGQFCVQDDVEIGNYPVLNVYANFYVRLLHLRFFAQYTHFNKLFMQSMPNYYAMPGYPMNPDVFRAGLAWHFYR